MKRAFNGILIALGVLFAFPALAAERTVTLAVQNMFCAACPSIVRKSLEAVPGVSGVVVSYKEQTAVVVFDDARTGVQALIEATRNAGYPSSPRG